MSAINIHVGTQDQADRQDNACGLAAPGEGLGAARRCIPPIAATHTGLAKLLWIRRALEDVLAARRYYITDGASLGKKEARDAYRLYFVIDPPFLQHELPWMPAALVAMPTVGLIGEAGKMACPTWDLPAGAISVGGACPGAQAGQTTVPLQIRQKSVAAVGMPVRQAETICQICVAGDARVLVRGRGLVRLDDLRAEEIEVWSGQDWRTTSIIQQGVRELVEVQTSWGQRIKVTPDHKLMTPAGMVEAQELEPGDQLVFEPVAGLPTRDAPLERRATVRGKNAVDEQFPSTWDFDVGLFLGYVLGDGSVYYAKNGYPSVVLAGAAADRADLEKIVALVASWCSTRAELVERQVPPSAFCAEPQRQAHVYWRVKSLVEFLEDCGLDKRRAPEERRVPEGLWEAGGNAVRGFLSGLFSTDGSVTVSQKKKIEISLASVSEGLLRDVQQLLFACGVRSSICAYTTSNLARVEQGYRPLWKLGINAVEHVRLFATTIGFFNQRKAVRLQQALHEARDQRGKQRLPVVVAVTPLSTQEPVYDLVNVGPERQFVANGITVSNCYANGGQYASPHVQAGEILRYWWCRELMSRGAAGQEEFVTTLVRAIQGETFPKERVIDPRTGKPVLPMRLHSSGDFFAPQYAEAWVEVCNRLPEVMFWAPTRTWAYPGWVETWRTLTARLRHRNLALRPSAYHTDDAAPSTAGHPWPGDYVFTAQGTSAVYKHSDAGQGKDPRYQWSCHTYAILDDAHTCQKAVAPDGKSGCRACWVRGDLTINYTAH